MKKFSILLLAIAVVGCALSHRYAKREQLKKELIAYAYYGDLTALKNAEEEGAPLTGYTLLFDDEERQYTDMEFSPIQAAASGGNEDVINYLLDNGANINEPTVQGWTPLFIALRDGHAEAAKLLVYRQADLQAVTDLGATALFMILDPARFTPKERKELLVYLLKRGADASHKTPSGLTPLYFAVTAVKDPEIVQVLLDYGADPATVDSKGRTLLSLAQLGSDNQSKKIAALLKKQLKK